VSGATQFGDLLRAEGYDVVPFTPTTSSRYAPPRFSMRFEALIKKGVYDQLVVYFAGALVSRCSTR
jgi:hypothetical protein